MLVIEVETYILGNNVCLTAPFLSGTVNGVPELCRSRWRSVIRDCQLSLAGTLQLCRYRFTSASRLSWPCWISRTTATAMIASLIEPAWNRVWAGTSSVEPICRTPNAATLTPGGHTID